MRIVWNSAPLRIAAAIAVAAGAGWLAARKGRDWAARKAAGDRTRERDREREHQRCDKLVNDASEASFPASDSPSYTQGTVGSPDRTG